MRIINLNSFNKNKEDLDKNIKCPACLYLFKNSDKLIKCKCEINSPLTTYYSNSNNLLLIYFTLNNIEWLFYQRDENKFIKKFKFVEDKIEIEEISLPIPDSIDISFNSLNEFLSCMKSLTSSLIYF